MTTLGELLASSRADWLEKILLDAIESGPQFVDFCRKHIMREYIEARASSNSRIHEKVIAGFDLKRN